MGQPVPDNASGDNWRYRRRTLFIALFWQAVTMTWIIIYAAFHSTENALYDQAFIAMAGASTSLLCAYIFGVVWDDHNKRMVGGNDYSSGSFETYHSDQTVTSGPIDTSRPYHRPSQPIGAP